MFLFFFGDNSYKNKETFKIFSPQILEVYIILLVKTTLESIMFYYTFSVINTMFVPCTALLYDSTAVTRTLIDNHWPSYSQDLNPCDYFLRVVPERQFVKTIHRQERTSSEEKSDGFHKKCSVELWTMLMFELLLCCHTAVERT